MSLDPLSPVQDADVLWVSDSIIIVPAGRGIMRSTDEGRTWKKTELRQDLPQRSTVRYHAVAGRNGYVLVRTPEAAEREHALRHQDWISTDYGETWRLGPWFCNGTSCEPPVETDENTWYVRFFHLRDPVDRQRSPLMRTTNAGRDWEQVTMPAIEVPDILGAHPDGRVFLGASYYSRDGQVWTRTRIPGDSLLAFTQVHFVSSDTGFCLASLASAVTSGIATTAPIHLLRTRDGGESWEIIDTRTIITPVPRWTRTLTSRRGYSTDLYFSYFFGVEPWVMVVVDSRMGRIALMRWFPYQTHVSRGIGFDGRTVLEMNFDLKELRISRDYGTTWTKRSIAMAPFATRTQSGYCSEMGSFRSGVLYYLTDAALYVSGDEGRTWRRLFLPGISSLTRVVEQPNGSVWVGASSSDMETTFFRAPASVTSVDPERPSPPETFTLPPAWPNPVPPGGAVHLPYALTAPSEVTILVRDLLGRIVARLEQGRRDPGHHEALWQPRGLAPGLYLTQVHAGSDRVAMGKVVVR